MTPAALLELLISRGHTVAFCESLTAGLASATLADAPGASAALRGGLVTYATEVKSHFLGVQVADLEAQGVVSAATAKSMARAAASHCEATWGVSLTGVAGPDQQEGKAPGTVYVGIARGDVTDAWLIEGLSGSRADIRRGAVAEAFALLGRCIESDSESDWGAWEQK